MEFVARGREGVGQEIEEEWGLPRKKANLTHEGSTRHNTCTAVLGSVHCSILGPQLPEKQYVKSKKVPVS